MGARSPMHEKIILKLHEDLKKVQGHEVTDDNLQKLIEDVRKLMRKGLDDFETN